MATELLSLFAKIGIDDKEFNKGINGAESKAKSASGGIGGAFKKGMKVAGAAIGVASAAVVGFATKSVQAGMDFDKAMSQVAATMGKTNEEMETEIGEVDLAWGKFSGNLREYAQEMGAHTAFSATQAAEALNYMALAGYDTQTSMEMLPNVLNLAAAGNMELATASDMVTDAQSALGLSIEETNVMVDQMAKASATTNTSVSQLGEAILTVGGTAKAMKGGTEELSAVLGVLADNGIKGAEGGTKLRNMILSLSSPTDDGAAALEKLGVSLYDANGEMKALDEVIGDLNKGMEGMSTAEKTNLINDIFNKQDLKAVNALLGTSKERWDEVYASIDDAAGSAQKMAETQLDNLAGDITLFKSALEGVQIGISDGLNPVLRDFVQTGTKGLETITEGVKEGGLVGGFEAIGTVLGDVITKIVEYAPEITKSAIALINALLTGLIDQAPTILTAGIEIINTLITGISENIGDIATAAVSVIGELAKSLSDNIETLLPAIVEMISQIALMLTNPDTLTSLLEAALMIITALANGFTEALPILMEALPQIIGNITTFLVENIPTLLQAAITLFGALLQALPVIGEALLKSLGELLGGLFAPIGEFFSGIFTSIGEFFANVWAKIVEFFQPLIDFVSPIFEALHDLFSSVFGAIKDIVTGIMKKVRNAIAKPIEKAHNKVKSVLLKIHEHFKKILSKIVKTVGKPIKKIKDKLSEPIDNFKKKIEDIKSKISTWGYDMLTNFRDGIVNGIKNVKDSLLGLLDWIKERFHFSVPDVGPLADSDKWMPDFMDLLADGINENKFKVVGAMDDLAGQMVLGDVGNEYTTETEEDVQRFEFTFAEGNAPLKQIARLLFPYMKVVAKEKGVKGYA